MSSNDVRIKVSLDGDKDVVTGLQGIGDTAGQTDSKLGSLTKGGLAGAGTALLGLAAGAVAAGGAMSAAIISSYADYEQNLGGIETLYKDSASKMVAYADEAYKTAGLSANEYMSQVTSFSAALLQGLGGDTAAAADYANTAMVDMSDNANKFGTDIATIQNAYQGFAKGNFTMLDNLKLGYGGTQEEMARLINESGVLGDTMQVTAETVNDVSFDKVVEAIHTVQDQMGIAGTTAKEASETIAGSLATLKGSFSNLLTGLGDPSADIEKLAGNVIESLDTVVGNIQPVIEQIGVSMTTLGPKLGEMIQGLVGTVAGAIPVLLEAGTSIIEGLISGVISALPSLVTALVPGLIGLVEMVATQLPLLLDAGLQTVVALGQGIVQAIPTLLPVVAEMITGLAVAVVDNLPMILEVSLQLIMALAQGVVEAIPVLVESLPMIIESLLAFFVDSIPLIIESGITLITSLVKALPEIIDLIVKVIPEIISSIIAAVIDAIPLLIEAGITLFVALIQALPTIIGEIVTAVPEIMSGIIGAFGDALPEMIAMGADLIRGLWEGIVGMGDWLLDMLGGFAEDVMGGIADFFGIKSPSTRMRDEIGKMLPAGIGIGIELAEDKAIKPIDNLSHRLMAEAMEIPDLVINRQFQTTSTTLLDTRMASSTPTLVASVGTEFASAMSSMIQELRDTPLTATVSNEDMDKLSSKVHSAVVSVRSADGRDATLAVIREVR